MMSALYTASFNSPLGELIAVTDEMALCGLRFAAQPQPPWCGRLQEAPPELPAMAATMRFLEEYFAGRTAVKFTAPLRLCNATPFRRAVWQMLRDIPYGATVSYGCLAQRYATLHHRRMSAQAIGNAVGHNPVAIVIPCHRVIGSNGSLTGYAAGIYRKNALLRLEAQCADSKSAALPGEYGA